MRILYLGQDWGSSQHRALALGRIGHEVLVVDPYAYLPRSRLAAKWVFETGFLMVENAAARRVLAEIVGRHFDCVWVDGGELIGPTLLRELRRRYGIVVNYNIDDPFGKRDRGRWRLYLKSVPEYCLLVVVRQCNVNEAVSRGARDVMLVYRSADEVAHAPRDLTRAEREKWDSDVAFVGTWMPERGPLLARLLALGVPLTIYGDRWSKAKEWPILRPCWRGPAVYGEDYAYAIQAAKVCLGLLSKGNRDLHTTRSLEVPFLGSLLCAERTSEHTALYAEDEEAVFWSDEDECARKCLDLLRNENRRGRIAERGRARCIANGTLNEQIVSAILARAIQSGLPAAA